MSTHWCRRCGHERRCSHGTWPDRHPAATTTLAVLVLLLAVAHPWLLGVLAVGAAAYGIRRERLRRQAIAARADWEHQQIRAAALRWGPMELAASPPSLPPVAPRRRRAADHHSTTEPIRTAS